MSFKKMQALLKSQQKAETKVMKGLHKRAEQIRKAQLKAKP